MRILYLIKSFDYGGAENHVLDLANTMSEMGNDVYVLAGRGLQAERLSPGVTFIPLRLKDFLLPFQALYVCNILSRYRIEIIHGHKRIGILLASIAGWVKKIPVIATVHGRPRYDLRSLASRKMTDRIIFVSGTTFEANRHKVSFRNKSVLIHNGVTISRNNTLKNHYSLVYICRIDKKHAAVISMLINKVLPALIREYPLVTLQIIGDGKYLEILTEEAAGLNRKFNREICIFHGFVNDVKPVIAQSGLILGVGRVALEALSCAVPVLSINRSFLGSLISRDNYNFYKLNNFVAIDHREPDPDEIARLLNDYLEDPEFWHSEAGELRKKVENDLGMQKIASEIHQLYAEACML